MRRRPGWAHQAGWHELGDKRAVLLVQLAPAHPRDDARLAYFLQQVPGWLRLSAEFRHPSWHCEDVFALLEAHRAAYCVMGGALGALGRLVFSSRPPSWLGLWRNSISP